jgi:hypothetical protein
MSYQPASPAGQDVPGLGSPPLARIEVLQAWPLIASLAQFHGFHEAFENSAIEVELDI